MAENRRLRRLTAGLIAAALLLTSPGPLCYQALAGEFNAPEGASQHLGASAPVPGTVLKLPGEIPALPPVIGDASAEVKTQVQPVSAASPTAKEPPLAGLETAAKTGDAVAKNPARISGEQSARGADFASGRSNFTGTVAAVPAGISHSAGSLPLSVASAKPSKPTRMQRFRNVFKLSEYNASEKAYIKGQVVFLAALSIYVASLPLLVQALTGSVALTGQARLVHFWTLAFASLISGKVVQKLGLVKVLRGGATARAVVFGAIGVLSLMHMLPWPVFLVLVGANALFVAHTTLTDMDEGGPGAVMNSDHKIEKAGYLYDTLFNAAMMIMPPLVGLGIDALNQHLGGGIGSKAAFVAFSVVMMWAVQQYSKVKVIRDESKKALLGFWKTVRLIKDNAAIRTRWLMSTLENFIEFAIMNIILPVYAIELLHLHGFGNGLLMSGNMLGGFFAGLAMSRFAVPLQQKMGSYRFLSVLTALTFGAFVLSAGLWLFPSLWIAFPIAMFMKLAYQPIRSRMRALLQVAIKNDAVAKDHPTEVFSLMNFTQLLAAGAGSYIFELLFDPLSAPFHLGPYILRAIAPLGAMAPMKILTICLAGLSLVYLLGLKWMKTQMTTPVQKTFLADGTVSAYIRKLQADGKAAEIPAYLKSLGIDPGMAEKLDLPAIEEAAAMAKLQMNLVRIGEKPYKTAVVEEAVSEDRPTSVILSPASLYKLSIAREGGRQSPGDVLLALDPSWLIQETTQDGKGARLLLKKGVTFDKDGQATVVEYKVPRRVRYFANFYTLGANDRDDGVPYEKDLDVPQSNSIGLEKITNDKLLTRLLLAAKNVAVPATLALLMPAHPLLAKAQAAAPNAAVQFAAMPQQGDERTQIKASVEAYLKNYKGDKIVVKPSGPQFHSARGVAFFSRNEVDAIVDHVLNLKADPMMTQDGAVLLDERLTPPALYLRSGDYQENENKDWAVLFGKRVSLSILRPDQLDASKPHETKDWNIRVLAARTPWGGGATTGMFGRAATYGKPTTAMPDNPADAAIVLNTDQVVEALRKNHGLLKSDEEAAAFMHDLKTLGKNAVETLTDAEISREREAGGPRQDQTDYIGLDVMVVMENGRLVPKVIEVNDHDSGGQWEVDEFYPHREGETSREWVATMLARARRDALKGKKIVVVGAGYPNKKFFLETARDLGIEVVMVAPGLKGFARIKDWVKVNLLRKPSADNWARDQVSRFIAVDTTKPEEALGEALRKLKKSGHLDGITTYWEDDVELTANLAQSLGLKYLSIETARLGRDKAKMRFAMAQAGIAPIAYREINARADIEAAVADPAFPFPAVLKPSKGAEGQFSGVVTREDALRVYDASALGLEQSQDPIFKQSHNFVLEEYLEGHEWDANIVMQNGVLLTGSVTDNMPIREDKQILKPGEKHQINMKSTGAALPSIQLTQAQQKEAIEFAVRVAQAMGATDGVFHIEGKTGPNGPRLLEPNLRPGGSYVVAWNKAVTGIDEAEMLFAAATGVPAVPFAAREPLQHLKGVFVFSDREGVVKKIDLKPEARQAGVEALVEKKTGSAVEFSGSDRLAFLYASGATPHEAGSKIGDNALQHLDLHIEPRQLPPSLWMRLLNVVNNLRPRP